MPIPNIHSNALAVVAAVPSVDAVPCRFAPDQTVDSGSEDVVAISGLAVEFEVPRVEGEGGCAATGGEKDVVEHPRRFHLVEEGVERGGDAVPAAPWLEYTVIDIQEGSNFIGGLQEAEVVGVVRRRFQQMSDAEGQVARHFAQGHIVRMPFIAVRFIRAEFAVDAPARLNAPRIVLIAQFEAAGLHQGIVACAFPHDHRSGGRHVSVVGQVLIGNGDGVRGEGGVFVGRCKRLQHPQSQAVREPS